jgi:hypothetical protein
MLPHNIARSVFEETRAVLKEIRVSYPWLETEVTESPDGSLRMKIPMQSGLKFGVVLSFDIVEGLYLEVGESDFEYFHWVAACSEVVHGLLSGEMRLLEYYKGGALVKSIIQELSEAGWVDVGGYSVLHFPWGRWQRVYHNDAA